MQRIITKTLALCAVLLLAPMAMAEKTVLMKALTPEGTGKTLGKVDIEKTRYGLVFKPDLQGLPPGMHGFHLHENGSCDPLEKDGDIVPGGAAGSHYDPKNAGHHDQPWADGHLGDLPALYADRSGVAEYPVLAPRLKMKHLKGRALIIHRHGDNYADEPKPLGGGGGRVACGLIE